MLRPVGERDSSCVKLDDVRAATLLICNGASIAPVNDRIDIGVGWHMPKSGYLEKVIRRWRDTAHVKCFLCLSSSSLVLAMYILSAQPTGLSPLISINLRLFMHVV